MRHITWSKSHTRGSRYIFLPSYISNFIDVCFTRLYHAYWKRIDILTHSSSLWIWSWGASYYDDSKILTPQPPTSSKLPKGAVVPNAAIKRHLKSQWQSWKANSRKVRTGQDETFRTLLGGITWISRTFMKRWARCSATLTGGWTWQSFHTSLEHLYVEYSTLKQIYWAVALRERNGLIMIYCT